MNRTDLMWHLDRTTSASFITADRVLESMFRLIADELVGRGEVDIVGFGRFETRTHAARTVSPQGVDHEIPERRIAKFVASPALKRKLNDRPRRR